MSDKRPNILLILLIIGFCLGVICYGFFYFGTYYACKDTGESIGYKCYNLIDLGVCHQGDDLYIYTMNNTKGEIYT